MAAAAPATGGLPEPRPVNGTAAVVAVTASQAPVASSAAGAVTPQVPGITAAATPATPVLVFLGGFKSCPKSLGGGADPRSQHMTAMFQATLVALGQTAAAAPAYLLGCYTTEPANIVYVLSTAPDAAPKVAPVQVMISDLEGLLATVPSPALYIVGHSYGGWTALDTALSLAAGERIAALITLDPISKVNCTVEIFIQALAGLGSDPGCLQFPTDLAAAATLTRRAETWLNFYQTDSPLLHSGPAPTAQNIQVHYGAGNINAHGDVRSDSSVIGKVAALIATMAAGK